MNQSTNNDLPIKNTPIAPVYLDVVSFLRILIVNSWVIALVTIIGGAATFLYVNSQPEVYESYASLIVLPFQNTGDGVIGEGNQLEALRLLNLNVIGTYVQVLRSRALNNNTEQVLLATYSEDDIEDNEVIIRPVENSSIITITARSTNPMLARDTAIEVANQVIQNSPDAVRDFVGLYPIEILDSADLPEESVAPQTRLVLVLGILGSGAVGVVLAFLFHNFRLFMSYRKSQNV